MTDPRHNSRIIALQRLFELSFPGVDVTDKPDSFSVDNLVDVNEITEYDSELVEKLVNGVVTDKQSIDNLISELAPEWPIDKIAKLDLHILRLAIAEGFILKITPKKVAIDEAIELAKEFSNDQTRKFISGVLGSLYEQDPE